MELPDREPVVEEEIITQKNDYSIFHTVKDIYMLAEDEETKLKCRIIFAMAKAMYEKLNLYKNQVLEPESFIEQIK